MKKEIICRMVLLLLCLGALMPKLALGQSNVTTTTLRIAIPVREFNEFVKIQFNSGITGEYNYSGFAIEVFMEVMSTIPSTQYKFYPFEKPDGTMNGTFDDMLQAVESKMYDGAVGEISILFYRMAWVDFTMPYIDSTTTMLVPRKQESASIAEGYSLEGITYGIVITTFVLSFIAFVIAVVFLGIGFWSRCFRANDNRPRDMTLRSLIQTRLMMITFFLLLLTLNVCYILSQTSSNLSQRKSGTIKNLTQLIRKGSNVGYREGSFIRNLLLLKGFSESKLKSLKSEEDMVDMLSKGTSNGGVDAIVASAPHLKLLQAKYCDNFTMLPTTNIQAAGFGFAFNKDKDLAKEVSKGLVKIIDNGKLGKIQERTIGNLDICQDELDLDVAPSFLSTSHKWILIVGIILIALLIILSFIFLF